MKIDGYNRVNALKRANEDLRKINKELINENNNLKKQLENNQASVDAMDEYKKQYEKSLELLNNVKSDYEKLKKEFTIERKKYRAEIQDLIKALK